MYLWFGYVKTYHRETKFERSRETNREESVRDKKKRRHFAIAPLCNDTTSLCNGYVAF